MPGKGSEARGVGVIKEAGQGVETTPVGSCRTRRAHGGSPGAEQAGRVWRYLWAFPVTFFGLLAVGSSLFSGGRARTHTGVLECHGGFARLLLSVTPVHTHAMTLGHVVLGRDAGCLERTRAHERVHVRQTEQFGALFPFAYLACCAWALLRGRHYYRDNWFERDARRSS